MRCIKNNIQICAAVFLTLVATAPRLAAKADTNPTKPAHQAAEFVTQLQDLQFNLTVTKIDNTEIEKIGKDFSLIYRLKKINLYYKNADRFRMESSSRVYGDALLISNGPAVFYAVPKLNVRRTDNLTHSPTQRRSLLELAGVLGPDTLELMKAVYVKDERLNDAPTEIYDLTYRSKPDSLRYRIWLDITTHVTLKREWYDGAGKLRATFTYEKPQEAAPGCWFPRHCVVKNSGGAVAAEFDIRDPKINQKLGDELFAIAP